MDKLAAVSLPSALPPATNSMTSHSAVPMNLPAITNFSAFNSLLTAPVLPMVTLLVEAISPSNSPSICSAHSSSTLPLKRHPSARVVTLDA